MSKAPSESRLGYLQWGDSGVSILACKGEKLAMGMLWKVKPLMDECLAGTQNLMSTKWSELLSSPHSCFSWLYQRHGWHSIINYQILLSFTLEMNFPFHYYFLNLVLRLFHLDHYEKLSLVFQLLTSLRSRSHCAQGINTFISSLKLCRWFTYPFSTRFQELIKSWCSKASTFFLCATIAHIRFHA